MDSLQATSWRRLAAVDALNPVDRQQVAVEILRRSTALEPAPEQALDELADALFQEYDVEEAGHGNS